MTVAWTPHRTLSAQVRAPVPCVLRHL